jgi:hypothetical protein
LSHSFSKLADLRPVIAIDTEVAEHLLAGPAAPESGDAPLPTDLSPDALRPLQRLDPALQSSCWRLATRITAHPTGHIVVRIVRTVEAAIHEGSSNGGTSQPKPKLPQSQKKVFFAFGSQIGRQPVLLGTFGYPGA